MLDLDCYVDTWSFTSYKEVCCAQRQYVFGERFKYIRHYLKILFIKFSCRCFFEVSYIILLEMLKHPDMPKSKTKIKLSFLKGTLSPSSFPHV